MVNQFATCATKCHLTENPCILAKLKSPWERGGFPLKCDRQILELLKSLKTRFDKERKRRSMTDDEERRVAENFSSTTLNLAPRNWLQAINEDKTGMRSDWRQEKIAFISDYIGHGVGLPSIETVMLLKHSVPHKFEAPLFRCRRRGDFGRFCPSGLTF